MSLISLADLKSFIHMNEIFDDALLQDIIDGVELDVSNNYLHSELAQVAGDVEYHDADRSNTIMLNNGLVTATPTVQLDSNGDFLYAQTLTHQTDFVWYAVGYIQLLSGIIATRRQKYIKVTYTHGYLSAVVAPAANLPTTVGFTIYEDRPSKIGIGYYYNVAGVVLNPQPLGAGVDWTENTDYTVMDDTGEVVAIEGGIADGTTVYVSAGTYAGYSDLPNDIRIGLLKMMSNTYYGSRQVMEVEGGPEVKIFSQKEVDLAFAKYRRLVI